MNFETYLTQTIQKAVKEAITEEFDELKKAIIPTIQSRDLRDQSAKPGFKSEIIRPKELAEMLSLSISTIYKMQGDGLLPPKIKISSHAVGWLRSDIEQWFTQKKES